MAKKTKAKKISFRQRLRNDAAKELADHVREANNVLGILAEGAGLDHITLAKLVIGSQTKTLEESAITTMANLKESKLEELYNTQLDLIPESHDGDKKEAK